MKRTRVYLLVASIAAVTCLVLVAQQGDDLPLWWTATGDWYEDPDCRLAYEATLEGLQRDRVPNEVVDLVIGVDATTSDPVKHNFVFRCKLCHAVFDAFVAYRRAGGTSDPAPADADLVAALRSDTTYSRVSAMGSLVQPWIEVKLLALELDDAAKRALAQRLTKLAEEGVTLTNEHRAKDPDYADWTFYSACQACEAVQHVSHTLTTNTTTELDR